MQGKRIIKYKVILFLIHSTVCKACIIKVGRSILYSLDQIKVYGHGVPLEIGHVPFLVIATVTNIIKLFNSPGNAQLQIR